MRASKPEATHELPEVDLSTVGYSQKEEHSSSCAYYDIAGTCRTS